MKTKAAKVQPGQAAATIADDASAKFSAHYGAERWSRLQRQALNSRGLSAEDLQALCIETLMTSTARHPDNAAAALCSAGNRLLIHLGSSLKAEDVARFEDALGGATNRRDPSLPGDGSSPLPA